MGDLFVHLKMKECCRMVLKEMDRTKRPMEAPTGLLATPSLFDAFGSLTIADAKKKAQATAGSPRSGGPQLDGILRTTCEKLCSTHTAEHEGKGEKSEARFWRILETLLQGKALPKASGDALARKARELVDKHEKAGTRYAQTGAKGTLDCSHFVHEVLTESGVDVPYVATNGIAKSPHFQKVDTPQPGDVVWQPGHMGVYVGTNDKGQPLGAQMGNNGPAVGVWGKDGWFDGGDQVAYYRPQ